MAPTCNSSTCKVNAGEAEVQGHSQIQKKFKNQFVQFEILLVKGKQPERVHIKENRRNYTLILKGKEGLKGMGGKGGLGIYLDECLPKG